MDEENKERYKVKNKNTIDYIEPDNELLVWEKWIKIRHEEIKKIAIMTNRPPADLVMNLVDKVRTERERKIVLEHAQIEAKAVLRGGPWEHPLRLKQACVCKPVYEAKRTAIEMGTPQVIEYVGVPKLIEESEKGVCGVPQRKPCYQLDTDYLQYRIKREEEWSKKIKVIDPFRPEYESLVVQGIKPKPLTKKTAQLPSIMVNEYLSKPQAASVYAVRINNSIFYKDIPDQVLPEICRLKNDRQNENCTTWYYYFKSPVNRAGRSRLYLKNLGTVSLRYCWRKVKKNIPFIPEDITELVFFFNKNEDVLPPGQTKELFFTFLSDKPGIFNECWELSFCNVCFFDTLVEKFVINLNADSMEDLDTIKGKIENVKAKIRKKVINNIISNILQDIIAKASSVKPQIYPYKELLLESEIFVMKNPVCFYHQTEVTNVKELYRKMAPDQQWDISIGTWRQQMMEKDFEDRMKYYELLKKSHRELLKPWIESEHVLHQKYRAMKWLLGQLADKFDIEYERALHLSGMMDQSVGDDIRNNKTYSILERNPPKMTAMRNIFYMNTYAHVSKTIENCAGILSSIDLNRWIDFDFCRV